VLTGWRKTLRRETRWRSQGYHSEWQWPVGQTESATPGGAG
jgi:hypothetical protein